MKSTLRTVIYHHKQYTCNFFSNHHYCNISGLSTNAFTKNNFETLHRTALFGVHNLKRVPTSHHIQCSHSGLGLVENDPKPTRSHVISDSSPKSKPKERLKIDKGPGLKDFIAASYSLQPSMIEEAEIHPYLENNLMGLNRKVFFDIYGCQMNVNDTEVVWSILQKAGFLKTDSLKDADVVLLVTCAIREGAETKVWNRLEYIKGLKNARARRRGGSHMKIGVLGCMAERLKHQLLEKEKAVDLVAGPDSYKDLPRLLALTENDQKAVNVLLSLDETYADVMPVRLNQDSVTAFVSIMRGCDNMCSYCIVPFTRGRERSRPMESILDEVRHLSQMGIKEITLLGQNVNSYRDLSSSSYYGGLSRDEETHQAEGFRTVYRKKKGGLRFADLLEKVSEVDPEMRIRFTSPHPKDFPDEVLHLINDRSNICTNLHMPAQSGSSAVLERMRRGYSREAYLELIDRVQTLVPGVTLSSDFICGFCGETDDEFNDTLTLMERVKYNVAYLFPYSMREKTTAHRRLQDDVPPVVKKSRLTAMVAVYREQAEKLNHAQIGTQQLVLVEGVSKRSAQHLAGRNDGNIKVIFPAGLVPTSPGSTDVQNIQPGDYVLVQIESASSQVLKGVPLYHISLGDFTRSRRRASCGQTS